MNQDTATLSKKNPRLDLEVVKDFERLASQVPLVDALKKGADYNLSHPLDTATLRAQHGNQKPDKARRGDRQPHPPGRDS